MAEAGPSRGPHLQAHLDDRLFGCREAGTCLGGLFLAPGPFHGWDAPYPLCLARRGTSGASSGPPAPTLTDSLCWRLCLLQRPGWGPAGGNQMLQRRTAGNNQPWKLARARSLALSRSLISLCLSASLSPPLPPDTHTPAAAFQPPRENKSRPIPDAPQIGLPSLPNSRLPLQTTPNFPSALLASAQTAPDSGIPKGKPPPGSGTRRDPHLQYLGALRRRGPRPSPPLRPRPGQAARPAPTWPGHSAARSESARRSRPFARSEPPSGPPTGPAPALQPGSAGS